MRLTVGAWLADCTWLLPKWSLVKGGGVVPPSDIVKNFLDAKPQGIEGTACFRCFLLLLFFHPFVAITFSQCRAIIFDRMKHTTRLHWSWFPFLTKGKKKNEVLTHWIYSLFQQRVWKGLLAVFVCVCLLAVHRLICLLVVVVFTLFCCSCLFGWKLVRLGWVGLGWAG